tara:strand:+ start:80 stop:406 length:327 start_codon:yes stop_codon:yes gene_type:complete
MIKNKLNIVIIIIFSILLYSCQSAKEALVGKKRSEQGDEFLVEKKNPLILPPDFEKLPKPGKQEVSPETFSNNEEVKNLLNIKENDSNISDLESNSDDIESAIIKKIQ